METTILGFIEFTWTPKVCKIMGIMAVLMGLGPLFYILLGHRPDLKTGS